MKHTHTHSIHEYEVQRHSNTQSRDLAPAVPMTVNGRTKPRSNKVKTTVIISLNLSSMAAKCFGQQR